MRASHIPSWLIGLLGTGVILVSTFLSSVISVSIEDSIESLQNAIDDSYRITSTKWENYKSGERRRAFADQFMARIFATPHIETEKHSVELAVRYLGGAVSAFATVIGGETDETRSQVQSLEERIRAKDADAYVELTHLIRNLEEKALIAINQVRDERAKLQKEENSNKKKRESVRIWFVALNILGLAIVLLKDLPIWRVTSREPDVTPRLLAEVLRHGGSGGCDDDPVRSGLRRDSEHSDGFPVRARPMRLRTGIDSARMHERHQDAEEERFLRVTQRALQSER